MKGKQSEVLLTTFRNASRAYSDASAFMHEAIARNAGLSGTDHKYLGLLLQHPKLTAGDIARLTGLSTGAVTGFIDRMEHKGLLKRKLTPNDRRKVLVIPDVKRIMGLLQPLFSPLYEKTSALIAQFSATEIETITRYFQQATEVLRDATDALNQSPQND